jgi:polar amino acid transport system substrate-binding protein
MFTALAAGNVDAVMTDLSVVLGQVGNASGKASLKVVGQYHRRQRNRGRSIPKARRPSR